MICPVHDDDRLAERRCIACIKGCVPLLVLFTEAHNNDIGLFNQRAGADRVDVGALVVMPELVGLLAQNGDTAIIRCRVVGDRR